VKKLLIVLFCFSFIGLFLYLNQQAYSVEKNVQIDYRQCGQTINVTVGSATVILRSTCKQISGKNLITSISVQKGNTAIAGFYSNIIKSRNQQVWIGRPGFQYLVRGTKPRDAGICSGSTCGFLNVALKIKVE
jgi:hypothetical protein